MKNNLFLKKLVQILWINKSRIFEANKKDVFRARRNQLSEAFIQRLVFDKNELIKLIEKIKAVEKLNSGLGEVIEKRTTNVGLKLQKVRVPIGNILIIYESRPEVTIDVTILCIKSGNKAILKGGSEAINTNKALFECVKVALRKSDFPEDAVQLITTKSKSYINKLLQRNDLIDLVIVRGGYKMVKAIQEASKIPVLAHSEGGARIYIDKSADLEMATKIIINAKTSKPSTCNSVDTIIIHKNLVKKYLKIIITALKENNIEIIENDWNTEFLGLKISIKIVNDENEAIKFIRAYSKKHSECIITQDKNVIKKFIKSIDAAALFINCSPRLHDGYIFGLGSEMGIATGKLHARGPVGLKELTTYKWIAYGKGQIRE